MRGNSYEGVLETWKLKVIRQRARRMGMNGNDLDDALQQVVMVLMHFRFDAERADGASERTAVTAVIDRQLKMMRRRETRAHQRVESLQEGYVDSYEDRQPELSVDVRGILEALPALDQKICDCVAAGMSIRQMSEMFGMSWHSMEARIESIRNCFERRGLAGAAPVWKGAAVA
ncbi:MAG: hypothetical protein U0795_20365 [Pirellulales bacterium]